MEIAHVVIHQGEVQWSKTITERTLSTKMATIERMARDGVWVKWHGLLTFIPAREITLITTDMET